MLRCLRVAIREHALHSPFLDVGCGRGDVSLWLAQQGWEGRAIDYSDSAVEAAKRALQAYPNVIVALEELRTVSGHFSTVLAWDVLEHIEDDDDALRVLSEHTQPGGHLVLSVPSHPSEWRWDDVFYGHQRRYTPEGLTLQLNAVGYDVLALWDSTFPVFWLLRRLYTRWTSAPHIEGSSLEKTKVSSGVNAWKIPVIGALLNRSWVLWEPLSYIQFYLFRRMVNRGHEIFVIAQKR
jgi:SAM-dependent methyltransferase